MYILRGGREAPGKNAVGTSAARKGKIASAELGPVSRWGRLWQKPVFILFFPRVLMLHSVKYLATSVKVRRAAEAQPRICCLDRTRID